jgi:uncharacterized protein YndB with AHSA1/START domain
MTNNPRSGPRILGSLRSADGNGVVRIEDRYNTDIDDLWSALTDPGRLTRWYGQVEGDLRPGGQFRLHVEDADADSTGRVEACEPPRHLRVTSRETDESYRRGKGVPPYDQIIEATLSADGDQTTLAIEVRGMPLDAIAFYGAGWQIHAENLVAYLAGRERGDTGDGGTSSSLPIRTWQPTSARHAEWGCSRRPGAPSPRQTITGRPARPFQAMDESWQPCRKRGWDDRSPLCSTCSRW